MDREEFMAIDPASPVDHYRDDGAEDRDDRESAGYYDDPDELAVFHSRFQHAYEQFDTREEERGER